MDNGRVHVICGEGQGKTTAAIGMGIRAIAEGKSVNMIQFLKGNTATDALTVLKRLEPEMKVFRFEKSLKLFEELNEEEQKDEIINIKNGLNFAKKVITTSGCDMIILDEILGVIDEGIIKVEDLESLLDVKPDNMDVIITGKILPDCLKKKVDMISHIENVKIDK